MSIEKNSKMIKTISKRNWICCYCDFLYLEKKSRQEYEKKYGKDIICDISYREYYSKLFHKSTKPTMKIVLEDNRYTFLCLDCIRKFFKENKIDESEV